MTTWPSDLPVLPILGFEDQLGDNVVRTAMDTGPAKRRRRTTARVDTVTWPMVLTNAQYASLKSFYTDDLADGVTSFTHVHPVSGAAVTFAFAEPPKAVGKTPATYTVSLKLEIQP